MSRPAVASVVAMLLPACIAAPLDRNAEAEGAAIVDGEITGELDSVVAISLRRARCGDSASVLCTGSLIAPDAVLSAAHCFDSMRPGLAYEVFVGEAVGANAQAISVLEVIGHPDFDSDTRQNDVAVLWLARPVQGVSPEKLPESTTTQPGLDDRVVLAGFGATTAGTAPDGLKRMGIGSVAELRPGVVTVSPDPSVSCVGDSGGPLFNEAGGLVGVASSGDTGCSETSVYALIAPTVEAFLDPILEMGPVERPLSLQSCGSVCTVDSDCPAGLVCVPGPEGPGFLCALPGQEAGIFTRACTDDGPCGAGLCARTSAIATCECYEPCTSERAIHSSRGCAVQGANDRAGSTWLIALLAWLGLRLRPLQAARLTPLRRRAG